MSHLGFLGTTNTFAENVCYTNQFQNLKLSILSYIYIIVKLYILKVHKIYMHGIMNNYKANIHF